MSLDTNILLICMGTGYVVGTVRREFRKREEREELRRNPPPVQPICGCQHHISYHDPKTGACNDKVKTVIKRERVAGQMNSTWRHDDCLCRRYVGPEPLVTFYAPDHATTSGIEQL
jgi:hypothetical protein